MRKQLMFMLVFVFGLSLGFIGCKTVEKHEAMGTEQLLAAAGFRQFPASTPERINALQTMKPRTIKLVDRSGKTFYVYPDPTHCNCLYAGSQQDYAAYRKLALEKQIAEDQLEASEANEAASMNGEMWGPWW